MDLFCMAESYEKANYIVLAVRREGLPYIVGLSVFTITTWVSPIVSINGKRRSNR